MRDFSTYRCFSIVKVGLVERPTLYVYIVVFIFLGKRGQVYKVHLLCQTRKANLKVYNDLSNYAIRHKCTRKVYNVFTKIL